MIHEQGVAAAPDTDPERAGDLRALTGEEGSGTINSVALIVLALALAVVLGGVGAAHRERARLQAVADLAALAGGRRIGNGALGGRGRTAMRGGLLRRCGERSRDRVLRGARQRLPRRCQSEHQNRWNINDCACEGASRTGAVKNSQEIASFVQWFPQVESVH